MQIKPRDYSADPKMEAALKERNVSKVHRDFYIYDEYVSKHASFGLENKICAGVVQVGKLLVRGLPREEGFTYDRPEADRLTFVKVLYFYNAFMNEKIRSISERFGKATLRPIIAIISAYTDTKQEVVAGFNGETELIPNQFGVSIYNFESQNFLSLLCNPLMIRDGLITKVSRLDIPDPRSNSVQYVDNIMNSKSYHIPTHFTGDDLARNGESKLHQYESYFKENNTFTEENLLKESKRIFSGSHFRFERENTSLAPSSLYHNDRMTADIRDKKRALMTLITDIIKASSFSLFESFTMMYQTGEKSGFRVIKSPFKQYHISYMEEKTFFVHTEFIKLCEQIVEQFGAVRIMLQVNDVEHIVRCTFFNQKFSLFNPVVTLRMTKLDCVNDFVTESLYGDMNKAMRHFKEEHELDLLNYYGNQKAGSTFLFNRGI
jgi:hypothetical protein